MDNTEKYVILRSRETVAPARGDMGRARRRGMPPFDALEVPQPIPKLEELVLAQKVVVVLIQFVFSI
jgi:hypothetical protein